MNVEDTHHWSVHLERSRLKGRTFLLGNKRAFSLSLPASSGTTSTQLHYHKWYGAYLYGRKFFEGQSVRLVGGKLLSGRHQTGLTAGLTSVRREYELHGQYIHETYFVPDGIQGFACTFAGNVDLSVEPEFDLRFYRALSHTIENYTAEPIENGVIVSNELPAGTYDDATETFLPAETGVRPVRLFAAAAVLGETTSAEMIPQYGRGRHKLFRKDAQRSRFLRHSDEAAADHAPLWDHAGSTVYAPVRLHIHGGGTVMYGFGASREEAIGQLALLRDNLSYLRTQKSHEAIDMLASARFETGNERVDTAYAQVLTRLMDSLVARQAVAEDTVLTGPATMILAGNQYFHDSWKRDENIALGFLLALGFYRLARDVIADTWQLQDAVTGRLPQRIRAGEAPPYHSSDGTLWALWRLYGYWRCTGDYSLVHEKIAMVQLFFRRSIDRSVGGLLPSGRTHAADYLWETWMDTPHTPRDGFPIEIQILWIACLRVFRPIMKDIDRDLEAAMERAETDAWLALQRYYVRTIPADSLDERGEARDLITPNPYFCFGVGLDLGAEVEGSMRDIGRRQLAGRQGIVTLAPQDWGRVFSPEFLGNRRAVRGRRMRSMGKFNYHRGVEWNWLAQFFVRAELKYGEPDVAFRKYLHRQIESTLEHAGIGGISELFDLAGSRGPEFQAWSMSGLLEALHAFGGVSIDVPDGKITIEPQPPLLWPHLVMRKWYGDTPLDLRYMVSTDRQTLVVNWPEAAHPNAKLDIILAVPIHHVAEFVDVAVDGRLWQVPWRVQPITGTARSRVHFSVPTSAHLEVTMGTKRLVNRSRRSA